MNYGRLVAAALAATVADAVYGFLVYGTLMTPLFNRHPAVFRSAEGGMAYLPVMMAGIFLAMIAAAAIYAKGYEGGSGLTEGGRFGMLFGFFAALYYASVNYGTLNIGRALAAGYAAAGFFEWTLAGIVIGLVYKGTPRR